MNSNTNTNVIVNWKNSKDFNEFLQSHLTDENRLTTQEIGMIRMFIYAYENDIHVTIHSLIVLCNCGQRRVESTLKSLSENNLLKRERAGNNINDGFRYVLNL